jgi:hypothetical protein
VLKLVGGNIRLVDEPAPTALNMRLRDDYSTDCTKGIERWNKIIARSGVDFRLGTSPCGSRAGEGRPSSLIRTLLRGSHH